MMAAASWECTDLETTRGLTARQVINAAVPSDFQHQCEVSVWQFGQFHMSGFLRIGFFRIDDETVSALLHIPDIPIS